MLRHRLCRLLQMLHTHGPWHVLHVIADKLRYKLAWRLQKPVREQRWQAHLQRFAPHRLVVLLSAVAYTFPYRQRPQHLADALSALGVPCLYVSPHGASDTLVVFKQINPHLMLAETLPPAFPPGCAVCFLVLSTDNTLSSESIIQLQAHGAVIYDYIDEISPQISLSPIPPERLALHARLLADATITVIASAAQLYQQVAAVRQTGLALVTNGVRVEDFQVERQRQHLTPAFAALLQSGRPLLGYYGALASWMDYALIQHVARVLPECILVLIGPDYDGSSQALETAPPNVVRLPPMPYDALAQHAIWFDICLIPFVVNAITQSTSPLKLYEYLALGKPVVTTALPECRGLPCVFVADDAEAFISHLRALLAVDRAAMQEPARQVAAEFSWQKKAQQIVACVQSSTAPLREGA